LAALSAEMGNHVNTLEKWKSGAAYANNEKAVMRLLDSLALRRRFLKQRRYAPGSRRRNKA